MKRSFQFQLVIRLLGMTLLIVLLNRYIAVLVLEQSLAKTIEQEIVLGLQQCASKVADREVFYSCYRQIKTKSPSKYLIDTFTVCAGDAGDTQSCRTLTDGSVPWQPRQDYNPADAALEFTDYDRSHWLGVRMRVGEHTTTVALTQVRLRDYLNELWSLRDAILWVSLLPIILAVLIMSWYIFFWVMKPIHSIENVLTELDLQQLDEPLPPPAQYREFEYIATVYESLRVRLKDSYEKIRSFTANASHELKTPLTILRGGTEKLINSLPLGSAAQIDARAIGDEIERLITITERLLLLSRADDNSMMLNFAKWDLSTFLDELADDAAEFQHNVKIIKHIAPGVIWHCDPVLAKQLIHNLYTNAAKYNIPKGQIVFALETRDGNLNLTIENTSANVAKDLPARAFERFYRADAAHNRQVDGMGLGLSICNKIAMLHNGVLEMTVSPSSVVTLTLTAPLDTGLQTRA